MKAETTIPQPKFLSKCCNASPSILTSHPWWELLGDGRSEFRAEGVCSGCGKVATFVSAKQRD